jgi:hypothetical protein
VLNLFKFFQLEKARERPFYSPDNLIKRTCKAAGISYSSVYRVVNGKNPPESIRLLMILTVAMFIYFKMSKKRFMKKFYVNF